MADYISRTLVADKGSPSQKIIHESEIASLPNPLIILGEPGIGKTKLTENLEQTLHAKRVAAGTFARTENFSSYAVDADFRLIIDGLDEVSAASGEPPLDGVLRKLDRLGRPKFIMSCRAADWQGTSDRWKIEQDYGSRPVTLHIEPFSFEQAHQFLAGYHHRIDPAALLKEIGNRGLQELTGNPLTLGLLAEVSLEGEGLPENKTKLLERASRLLVKERNPAHGNSPIAQARVDDLLLSAGAIAAHLLISSAFGVSTGQRESLPVGFIHSAEIEDFSDARLAKEVINTRLFRNEGEGLFLPIHRVIAEYLGAHWLSRRLQSDLSERRLFQALEFNGGVPTALRGLHAWLGHFTPSVADRCIRTDPYGVLRYAETDQLPTLRARLLLSSLAALANEDPYFRSEDWGTRAISGLARPELKSEIISVVRSPDRHVHLSSLLLEALPGSALTQEIVPQLLDLISDCSAPYIERHHAAEALIASHAKIDWPEEVAKLRKQLSSGDNRLAIEIISKLRAHRFTPKQIAGAIVDLHGTDKIERGNVVGTDYRLIAELPAGLCAEVLDGITDIVGAIEHPPHWSPNYRLASAIQRLAAKALEGCDIAAARFWSWVRFIDGHDRLSQEEKHKICYYLEGNARFRHEVQEIALKDKAIDGGPWMAIAHELPHIGLGLEITQNDAAVFLDDIAALEILTEANVTLWTDLVRAMDRPANHIEALDLVIRHSVDKHPRLATEWQELTKPLQRDWEKEEQRREASYRTKKAAEFAQHRAWFVKLKVEIETGREFGALYSLAASYLGHYSDLDSKAAPLDRIRNWVGDDIADIASKGFVASLVSPDLPTVAKIMEARNEGKQWTLEHVMLCGVAELVRTCQSLDHLPEGVATAVLAIWWHMPEFYSTKLGEDMEEQLEARVFHSNDAIEQFLVAVLEPPIKAGKDHISGLYRLPRDARFTHVAASLALHWLKTHPQATQAVQRELLLIRHGEVFMRRSGHLGLGSRL